MGEVVNLRRVRKGKVRAEAAAQAAANRARSGLTKAERALQQDRDAKQAAALDGAKLHQPGTA